MKILIACEFSGIVRNAFLDKGHDAWSCDLLPSDDRSNRHIQDDIRKVMYMDDWDFMMVAHPPCTRLCLSGNRWYTKPPKGKTLEQLEREKIESCKFVAELWDANIPKIAIENPLMRGDCKELINKFSVNDFNKQNQIIQPYEFAESLESKDNITKKTALWLKNLPNLVPTSNFTKDTACKTAIHHVPPGPDRWKIRSTFFPGIAKAMAEQWG